MKMLKLHPGIIVWKLSETELEEFWKQVNPILDEYEAWLKSYEHIDDWPLIDYRGNRYVASTLTGIVDSMVDMRDLGIPIPRSLFNKISSLPDIGDPDDYAVNTGEWPPDEEYVLIDETK